MSRHDDHSVHQMHVQSENIQRLRMELDDAQQQLIDRDILILQLRRDLVDARLGELRAMDATERARRLAVSAMSNPVLTADGPGAA